jgi:hypothetical protein
VNKSSQHQLHAISESLIEPQKLEAIIKSIVLLIFALFIGGLYVLMHFNFVIYFTSHKASNYRITEKLFLASPPATTSFYLVKSCKNSDVKGGA